ncbi:MAG: helix-turn-helix transcriptional regulator [Flavonifractor sp.]|nr:helix-turn-helix transcriptional regulator [Flavonifractor sp.]
MSKFGELLAELRLDRKMTQKDLAKMLFVSVGTISNYEKGVHFPDIEKLIDLADFFHVTTDYLLGRCESNLSPDVFSESVVGGKTVGDFITVLRQLPAENKKALALIISEMEFCMAVRQYDKRESI